ncbi:hypothetical protein DFR70_102214 [Nocardia tenerifensis]|uniref:Uncharacterized protein n=1 Tax=Nocardia tenerifensis TaxID=228006 RepID=A0A318K9X7_9NOCA|nr:hypothetical protein [Nocardia tenerifensis]PXX68532.1 hypothetical protein DFR70_102214 [Nocardia tenerifensis]
MAPSKTLDEINTTLQSFSDQITKVREQPAKVDEAFKKLAIAAAASEGGVFGVVGAVVGGIYGSMTEDDFTGTMSAKKEEIKDLIKTLLEKLADAIEALKAPIALLQTSGDWLDLKTKIGAAQNNEVVRGDLTGKWQGSAADSYRAARIVQDTALDSIKGICDTVNAQLLKVSDASWTFYSEVAEQLVDFLASLGTAIGKIATVVSSPIGISDCIDLIKKMITFAVSAFKTLTTALRIEVAAIDAISAATANPKGLLNNKWPQTATTDLDINSPNNEKWKAQ